MTKQRKQLYAKTKAIEMDEESIRFYDVCKTLKVYSNSEWDKKLVEYRNNKRVEELKQKRREIKLQAKLLEKQNTMLFKQLRQRKQFEQEMVA